MEESKKNQEKQIKELQFCLLGDAIYIVPLSPGLPYTGWLKKSKLLYRDRYFNG